MGGLLLIFFPMRFLFGALFYTLASRFLSRHSSASLNPQGKNHQQQQQKRKRE